MGELFRRRSGNRRKCRRALRCPPCRHPSWTADNGRRESPEVPRFLDQLTNRFEMPATNQCPRMIAQTEEPRTAGAQSRAPMLLRQRYHSLMPYAHPAAPQISGFSVPEDDLRCPSSLGLLRAFQKRLRRGTSALASKFRIGRSQAGGLHRQDEAPAVARACIIRPATVLRDKGRLRSESRCQHLGLLMFEAKPILTHCRVFLALPSGLHQALSRV